MQERVEYDQGVSQELLGQTSVELLTATEMADLASLRKQSPRKSFSYLNQKALIIGMAIFVLLTPILCHPLCSNDKTLR